MKKSFILLLAIISIKFSFAQCPITINSTQTSSTICNGNSVNFTTTGNDPGIQYTWSPSTGLNSTSISNPIATPTSTTNYTVTGLLPTGLELLTNGNFESGNIGFSSNYNYVGTPSSTALWNEGAYTVGTNPNNYHSQFPNIADHSTIGNNFLIVNGAAGIGTKVWCQTLTVTPGQTYMFSCWATTIVAASNSELAILNFDVNGVNIGPFFSPTITSGQWTQYTASWTCPMNISSMTLCIENANTTGAGNDFGLDDITFKTACTATNNLTINVISPIANNNGPICTGGTINLTANTLTGVNYAWTGPNNFNSSLQNPTTNSINTGGTYTLTETLNGVSCSTSTNVTLLPLPQITVNNPITTCLGSSVNLTGTSTGTSPTTAIFSSTGSTQIPDGGISSTWTGTGETFGTSNIIVSNLYPNWNINSVTLNITHTWDSDIKAYLFDPCGNSILLVNSNGNSSDNFTNTTFTPSATQLISSGIAPFTGNFIPADGQTAWNTFITNTQNCGTANGTWSIKIGDMYSSDQGTLDSWSLNFTNNIANTFSWTPTTNMTNSTSLTPTIIPTSPGTINYILTANNSYGCQQTLTTSVTAINSPTATISGSTQLCPNSSTTINFNGTPNATVTYMVNNGTNQTIQLDPNGNASITTPNLNQNTTYTLVSVAAGSCSQLIQGSAIITMGSNLNANILGSTSICTGNTTNINFTGTANSMITYTINNGTNQTIQLDNLGTASLTSQPLSITTTYQLVSVEIGACSQLENESAIITVISNPTASVSGTTSICENSTTVLHFSGTPNASINYTINNGSNNVIILDNTGNADLTSQALTNNTIYTITSVIIGSCTENVSSIATITILPLPSATITGTTTICAGNSTNIVFNGTPNAIINYTINGGSTLTTTLDGNGNSTISTGNLNNTVNYTLTNCMLNTCSQNYNLNVIVSVFPLPVATISGDTTICIGSDVSLQFQGTPNAFIEYMIDSNPIQTIQLNNNGTLNKPLYNILQNTAINLISVSLGTNNFCSQSLNQSIIITVENPPIVNFTADKFEGCVPMEINIINSTQGANAINWNLGDGSTISSLTNFSHTFNQEGCFDVTATAISTNGCISIVTTNDLICLTANPTAQFNPASNSLNESEPSTQMINTSQNATIYEWNFGDGTYSLENSPIHTFSTNQEEYSIILIASNPIGCSDTAYSTVKINEDLLFFVPNTFTPDGNTYNQIFQPIITKGVSLNSYELSIYNRWGQIVYHSNDTSEGWNGTFNDLDALEGIYTWKITFKLKSSSERKSTTGHVLLMR